MNHCHVFNYLDRTIFENETRKILQESSYIA